MSETPPIEEPAAPETAEPAGPPPSGDASARAGRYYRNTRYLLAIGLIAYGIWNYRDGFIRWPAANDAARKAGYDKLPYSDMDLAFNRALAFICPAAGLAMLGWALHASRGEYKIEGGQTLYVPGHPPISLDQVEALDKQKWERKGIAFVTYRQNNGKEATFKLDDFVYDRDGVDTIFQWIEWSLQQPHAPKPAPIAAVPPPPPPPNRAT